MTEWLDNFHKQLARVKAGRMPSISRRFKNTTEKGPNGKKLCKVCGKEGKGSMYCSQECHEFAYAFHGWGSMRRYVYKRDGGKCVGCGMDIEFLERVLRHTRGIKYSLRRELGFRGHGDLFDTDHIIPVIDGGTYEPENLRTLCTPCHKIKTAALAKRRADDKRLSQTLFAVEGKVLESPCT